MPRMEIPKKLLPLFNKPKRFKIAIGGRGSGKSMTFADLFLMDAQTKGIKTACFREYQKTIDDSVHALLANEILRLGLKGFDVQRSRILYNGEDVFKFRGLARDPEGVKSMHSFSRFWIEEGQTISLESLTALTPTLRTDNSEIWFSANPRSSADPFSQRFIKPFERELIKNKYYEDDLHIIVWVNYTENPLFPEVLEAERQFDERNLSTALYRHIWLGEHNDSVPGSVIELDWFNAAIDAHEKLGFKPLGAIIAAHDPSDIGPDPKGYALRHGSVILDVEENQTGDTNQGMDWALDKAIRGGADWFCWDCDGLGVSLKRQVDQALEGKRIDYFMFKGSEEPENPNQYYQPVGDSVKHKNKSNRETFTNRRAQFYWKLRDRFYATYRAVVKGEYINPDNLISLSSNIECMEQLRSELCRIPIKPNNNGRIQIMSKKEMLKKPYQLPSPNLADSVMMAMYAPQKQGENVRIKFEGWKY